MSSVLTSPSTRIAPERGDRRRLGFPWLLPLLGVGALLTSCILWSLRKPMWGDEVFTWTELQDPSFLHLFRAVPRLGGGGMPLFYLTAWPWAHVFGFSDLSLRLYSSLGVCGALLVLFEAMRRRFSARAAFLGTAFGLGASLIVLDQNSEARGYGLYLLLAALAIAQVLRVAEIEKPRLQDLALLALAQAGLVLGHTLGLLYAGLLLMGLVAADLWQGRVRIGVWLACVAGWLALIPWIPAIKASAAVGRPHSWIAIPTLGDLVSSLSFWLFTGLYWQIPHLPPVVLLAGWLCAVGVVGVIVLASLQGFGSASPGTRTAVFVGLALLLGPMIFFVVSHVATPIFLPRYLLPSALGVCVLAVVAADRADLGERAGYAWSLVVLGLPVAAALLAHPVALNVARVDQLAAGRRVVCDSLKDFLVMTRYTAHPETPRYPLDAEAASTVPGADTDVRLMQNYRREGYFSGHLPDPEELLRQPSFLVLENGDAAWFRLRIENNSQWTWKTLAQVDGTRRLVEVRRTP